MKHEVIAAVIKHDDKYLCMQRCRSHYPYISEHWEFPGGKRKEGECDHETLIREIKEEMDWDVFVGKKIGTINHSYPDFEVSLTAYICKGDNNEFKLLEHLDYKWMSKHELLTLNWTEADRRLIEQFDF